MCRRWRRSGLLRRPWPWLDYSGRGRCCLRLRHGRLPLLLLPGVLLLFQLLLLLDVLLLL